MRGHRELKCGKRCFSSVGDNSITDVVVVVEHIYPHADEQSQALTIVRWAFFLL